VFNKEEFDVEKFVAGAEKWDELYLKATIHAVERYNDPRDARATIQQFLSRKNRGAFKLTNPHSKQIWLRELILAYRSIRGRDERRDWVYYDPKYDITCSLVTFTHESWACPDTHIEFNLKRAKQKVRNALSGLSFVATFEAACYVNEEWKKDGSRGKLVSFHCHAVVWATNRAQLSRRRTTIKPRFRPILGNKSGVRFDALKKADDVCKAIRYQAKMPALGYRTVPVGWGKKTQRSAKLSYLSRYRLFSALQQYDLLDFWLAGGEGTKILREARTKLNEHRERKRGRGSEYRTWMGSPSGARFLAF
jgi:hypothetical protein